MKTDWGQVASDLAALARPIRMFVWTVLIVCVVIYILFTGGKTDNTGLMLAIIGGLFSDLGVNSILRSQEKNTIIKTEGTTKVAETVTKDSTNTNIENINLNNETVNIPTKQPDTLG